MKRLVIAILILLPFAARAQQVAPPGYVIVDSLVFTPLSAVDTTLEGSTIFNVLPDEVSVSQSGVIRNAVETRIRANRSKQFSGYRIRIFFAHIEQFIIHKKLVRKPPYIVRCCLIKHHQGFCAFLLHFGGK